MRTWKLSILFSLCLALLMGFSPAPNPADGVVGAWELVSFDGNRVADIPGMKAVRIFTEGYTIVTYYNLEDKTFDGTHGGTYTYNGTNLVEKMEVNTWDPNQVGTQILYETKMSKAGEELVLTKTVEGETSKEVWKRIDSGDSPLLGAWRITGRMQDGEMRRMEPRGARKTLKILSGSRFQWCAINPETKQFFGTGGGTYTFENGKYVETIEFFSRDGSRVGMSLSFDGKVEDGDWHHSGKSSKGDPIHEIWSKE